MFFFQKWACFSVSKPVDKADRHAEVEMALEKARNLVSVDLVTAAKAELRQLELFEKHPELLGEEAVTNAIRRYETCWLPMKVRTCAQDRPKDRIRKLWKSCVCRIVVWVR